MFLRLFLGLSFTGLVSAQVDVTVTARPGTVSLAPGVSGTGWFFDGQLPGPVLRVPEGELLRVRYRNELPEPSTIHWHGLPVPLGMDGVPGVTRPPVEPGQEFTYEFVAEPSGTYFYHPHVGLQLDRGLYGIVIVEERNPSRPPADRDYLVVLDDWRDAAPVPGIPTYSTYLINGRTSAGQSPLIVAPGERVRLRFVNASAFTEYAVAIDGHPPLVTHADGQPVQPVTAQAIPLGAGERYDVEFVANNPGTWSIAAANLRNRSQTLVRAVLQYTTSTQPDPSPGYVPPMLSSGALLTYSQLAAAGPVRPLATTPQRVHDLTLSGGMMGAGWTINGQAYPNAAPLVVAASEDVRFVFRNMSMMYHPMHVHGHFFRLVGSGGGTTRPLVKDTILVQPGMMQTVSAEVFTDNPGNWALHCHNIYHAEDGMMRLVQYGNTDHDGDGLGDGIDLDPRDPYPVLTTHPLGNGYRVGLPLRLDAQWPAGRTVWFAVAPAELLPAISLGEMGLLRAWPLFPVAAATTQGNAVGSLTVPVPNDPEFLHARFVWQAIADHAVLAPGWRLSTHAVVTILP